MMLVDVDGHADGGRDYDDCASMMMMIDDYSLR